MPEAANSAAMDIDPQAALELLPQKIAERKKIISAMALDLSIVRESEYGDANEKIALEKQLAAQKDFLRLYEARLEAITKAVRGE